jgi:predicted N-acetyltransferase YhbS
MDPNPVERELSRAEVEQVWTIDRAEVIEAVYYYEDGGLVLKPEHWDVSGWPPGEPEKYTPLLFDCFDRGGWFYGLFDGSKLVALVILESEFIGWEKDQLQMKFLHVSQAYRKQGLGGLLFERAAARARRMGVRQLYVSATPSQNTIDFYLHLGCRLAPEPDPALYALEPEDIHLVYDLEPGVNESD